MTDDEALFEAIWVAVAEVRDSHPRLIDDAPTDEVVAAALAALRDAGWVLVPWEVATAALDAVKAAGWTVTADHLRTAVLSAL